MASTVLAAQWFIEYVICKGNVFPVHAIKAYGYIYKDIV